MGSARKSGREVGSDMAAASTAGAAVHDNGWTAILQQRRRRQPWLLSPNGAAQQPSCHHLAAGTGELDSTANSAPVFWAASSMNERSGEAMGQTRAEAAAAASDA